MPIGSGYRLVGAFDHAASGNPWTLTSTGQDAELPGHGEACRRLRMGSRAALAPRQFTAANVLAAYCVAAVFDSHLYMGI